MTRSVVVEYIYRISALNSVVITGISCPEIDQPVNTKMQLPTSVAYNTVQYISCIHGYWFKPGVYQIALTCMKNMEWSQQLTACQRKYRDI